MEEEQQKNLFKNSEEQLEEVDMKEEHQWKNLGEG